MDKNKKYIFKGSLFSAKFDMLAAKKLPTKSYKKVLNSSNREIRIQYHVNELANQLHPIKMELIVDKIINESIDTKSYILKSTNNQALPYFRPGQYISLKLKINDTYISRPYSISSSCSDALNGFYRITVKLKPNGYVSNFIFTNLKEKDVIVASGPQGEFYYDDLRDPKDIIAIAGGSGITPFLSIAKAINENILDLNLTILYGCKNENDILFKNELDEIVKTSNNKVNVVYVLSESNNSNYQLGFINLDLIKRYYKQNNAIWFCGSKQMYKYVMNEIRPLNIEQKLIRSEAHNDIGLPSDYSEYRNINNQHTYKINIKQFDKEWTISANANETIIVNLQKAGITIKSNCLTGLCSWCKIKVNKGQVFVPSIYDKRREADKLNNIYHSCCSFAVSDLEIEAY